MTDLTEQWKKGELPEGHYYIKTRNEINIDEYIQWYKDHGIPSEKSFAYFNVQQVLAPVPSYEEWKKHKDVTAKTQIKNCDLEIINAQLKELLKECKKLMLKQIFYRNVPVESDEIYRNRCLKKEELLTKIEEVLK